MDGWMDGRIVVGNFLFIFARSHLKLLVVIAQIKAIKFYQTSTRLIL